MTKTPKNKKIKDVRAFKLTSGEDIISEVVSENEHEYILHYPLMLTEIMDEDESIGVALVNYPNPFLDSAAFTVSKDKVIVNGEIIDEMRQYYFKSLELQKLSHLKIRQRIADAVLDLSDHLMERDNEVSLGENVLRFPGRNLLPGPRTLQ